MDFNYAIFISEPINNLNDLVQIGLHNKREKKAYNSNHDIDITESKDNIEIVPLADRYVKGFYNLTEQGISMLATILKSDVAIEVSIRIQKLHLTF